MNTTLISIILNLVLRNPILMGGAGFVIGLQYEASHPGAAKTILTMASQWLGAANIPMVGELLDTFAAR
jgi:hypothetical protein